MWWRFVKIGWKLWPGRDKQKDRQTDRLTKSTNQYTALEKSSTLQVTNKQINGSKCNTISSGEDKHIINKNIKINYFLISVTMIGVECITYCLWQAYSGVRGFFRCERLLQVWHAYSGVGGSIRCDILFRCGRFIQVWDLIQVWQAIQLRLSALKMKWRLICLGIFWRTS